MIYGERIPPGFPGMNIAYVTHRDGVCQEKEMILNKILIIHVGHVRDPNPEFGDLTGYGDVLRSTVLLHLYKNDHVTWLVDEKAYPILKNNPLISRIFIYDLTSVLQLQSEQFDTVINLDTVPGLCALADQISAAEHYGFRFDKKTAQIRTDDGTHNRIGEFHEGDPERSDGRYIQEYLFEMVGQVWQGEDYIFQSPSPIQETSDIGFHWLPDNRCPSKAWPMESWRQLEELLRKDYAVSWQEDFDDMEDYFNWIQRCRLIVTHDDFGLHLAIALKKKIVAIFSSTDPRKVYLYGRGAVVTAGNCLCSEVPCHRSQCRFSEPHCYPEVQDVDRAVRRLFDPVDPAAQLAERLVDLADRQQKSMDEIRRYASMNGMMFPTLRK